MFRLINPRLVPIYSLSDSLLDRLRAGLPIADILPQVYETEAYGLYITLIAECLEIVKIGRAEEWLDLADHFGYSRLREDVIAWAQVVANYYVRGAPTQERLRYCVAASIRRLYDLNLV